MAVQGNSPLSVCRTERAGFWGLSRPSGSVPVPVCLAAFASRADVNGQLINVGATALTKGASVPGLIDPDF
jgi:hypothetical protein